MSPRYKKSWEYYKHAIILDDLREMENISRNYTAWQDWVKTK